MQAISRRITLLGLGLFCTAALAADPVALRDQHTHRFSYDERSLDGAGAAHLRAATARSQFVLLGEVHMDHEVPRFAGALFTMLQAAHGVRHLVVEQDPQAIRDALDPTRRGDALRLAAHAKRYPTLYEFDSDEDLAMLARVSQAQPGPDAIWGVEQLTGVERHLEVLLGRARTAGQRERVQALLPAARSADPGPAYSVNWLISPAAEPALAELAPAFAADPMARALINDLAKSAEIFGYYRRAQAGEPVALFNNTVREEVLKAHFIARYRAAAAKGTLPRAMFKFGANHLYRGKNPTQAFPIGNLAHELAVFNGMEAYGVFVMAVGPDYVAMADLPAWTRPLLPAEAPTEPLLVDLRALRPHQRLLRESLPAAEQTAFRELINGYDALVLLPNSRPATRVLADRTPYPNARP